MRKLEMIDDTPVFLEEDTYCDVPCYTLKFWASCDKVTFTDLMSEEDLLKLQDVVTEFVNKSLALKRKEQ